jgi:hypothetical protein
MTNFESYNSQRLNSTNIWLTFLLIGWSYGSMGSVGKQIFFYITFGGFGIWTLYRLFTLNKAIKNYNKTIALKCGLSSDDLIKLGLI